jgi:broad specificity phosphatase PhoE
MRIDTELRSWDVGTELEGKSIEANKDIIKRLKSQPDLVPVGGQSWGDYLQQARRFFNRYWEMGLESGPLLLVLHGSGIQIIWDLVGEMELSPAYDRTPLEPSGLAAIYQGREGPKVKILRGAKANKDE